MRSSVPHCDTLTLPASRFGGEMPFRGAAPRGKWQSLPGPDPAGADTKSHPINLVPLHFEDSVERKIVSRIQLRDILEGE